MNALPPVSIQPTTCVPEALLAKASTLATPKFDAICGWPNGTKAKSVRGSMASAITERLPRCPARCIGVPSSGG
jgi:hypothetical protein